MPVEIKQPEVLDPNLPPSSAPAPVNVTLDWQSYFYEFCAAHSPEGQGPVQVEGVLLFVDGWRYSATDYAGPEYPPPSEEYDRTRLLVTYWRRRLTIARNERDKLQHMVDGLDELRKNRPVPLQQVTAVTTEEVREGRLVQSVRRGNSEVDWQGLYYRLKFLIEDVRACEENLVYLGERL